MARPIGTKKNGLKYLNQEQLKKFFQAVDRERNPLDCFIFRLERFKF